MVKFKNPVLSFSLFRQKNLVKSVREELDRLDKICFPDDDVYDKIDGDDPDCPGEHVWWLAKFKPHQVVVGFGGLKIFAGGQKGFLCRSGVSPNYRNIGIHQQLINARVKYSDRLGISILETYTSRDNYQSANNLLRAGFYFCPPCVEVKTRDSFIFFRRKLHDNKIS